MARCVRKNFITKTISQKICEKTLNFPMKIGWSFASHQASCFFFVSNMNFIFGEFKEKLLRYCHLAAFVRSLWFSSPIPKPPSPPPFLPLLYSSQDNKLKFSIASFHSAVDYFEQKNGDENAETEKLSWSELIEKVFNQLLLSLAIVFLICSSSCQSAQGSHQIFL